MTTRSTPQTTDAPTLTRSRRGSRRRRQGMTEYIIIVGLIAILLIGAVTQFREALGGAFSAADGKIDTEVTAKINGAGAGGGGGAGGEGGQPQ